MHQLLGDSGHLRRFNTMNGTPTPKYILHMTYTTFNQDTN